MERFPVPEEALREALLNAIIHRDYSVGAPIQIRVRDDQWSIWNPGELPEGWSLAKFLKQHSSRPFNPCLANAFFRAGEIEAHDLHGVVHDGHLFALVAASRDASAVGGPNHTLMFDLSRVAGLAPIAAGREGGAS